MRKGEELFRFLHSFLDPVVNKGLVRHLFKQLAEIGRVEPKHIGNLIK